MANAIEFNHVSKLYRLGLVSTGALKDDMHRFWVTRVLGKEDPYLKIGATNDRTTRSDSDYVWALKDIDFKVEQGDVVGIIGKNGAGKSTLLKILSRVTGPTTGTIKARGRIGSLLEVGTGFHPEMTGRENIFMNGAILGMTHKEIQSKLDAIIDFSGCERYIDTPVKRYSSGMMVRLGFAVAAHLEPEIMVVDEVLAVGDAEFQKKAIGKMKDVSRGEGRTVLFVSHNMGSIRNLCNNSVVLKNGSIDFIGTANDAVDYYMQLEGYNDIIYRKVDDSLRTPDLPQNVEFVSIEFSSKKNVFFSSEPIEFIFIIKANKDVPECRINTTVFGMDDIPIGGVSNTRMFTINKGDIKKVSLKLYNHNLALGTYKVSFSLGSGNLLSSQKDYDIVHSVLSFKIDDLISNNNDRYIAQWKPSWGKIMFPYESKIVE